MGDKNRHLSTAIELSKMEGELAAAGTHRLLAQLNPARLVRTAWR